MSLDGRPAFPPRSGFSCGLNAPQAFAATRMQAASQPALESGRRRLLALAAGFLACFLLLAGRLFDVMILNPDTGPAASAGVRPALAARADIVDRNGELLATSLQMASLAVDPGLVLDEKELLTRLKTVLPGLDTQALSRALHSKKRFVNVRAELTPKQEQAINAFGLPSVIFRIKERRVYPKGALTAHVIGYNNTDQKGLSGIEYNLNERLSTNNTPLALSLDIRLQGVLHNVLEDGIRRFNGVGAAGLIMDAHTGEILALVSLPDFDPNTYPKAPDNARFNRATLGGYEMGSIFKVFTLAQALDENLVRLSDSFDCTRPLKFGRFRIRDYHPEKRWLTVPEIFVHSSNIGAAHIIARVTIPGQKRFLKSLGLLDAPALELPEVAKPLLPKKWTELGKTTISYGHGLAVNAVQLAGAVASVVNGGYRVTPTLLKRDSAPEKGPPLISPATSAAMRGMMRAVVVSGTGKSAEVPGYLVGGKTGTADKPAGGGYNRNARLASFIAAFPINEPRYLVFAMIDEPKGNKETHGFATGGWVAAPVVGKVIAKTAALLRIPPVNENDPKVAAFMYQSEKMSGKKAETAKNQSREKYQRTP